MFDNYLYVSGTSKVLVNHFKSYTDKVIKKIKLNKNSSILDIACNDGTFLNFFVKKNFAKVVGVDPAKNLRRYNKERDESLIRAKEALEEAFTPRLRKLLETKVNKG